MNVHPIDCGQLPLFYAVMSTGQGRLPYRAYYKGKPIGAPKGSVRAARAYCWEHNDDLQALRRVERQEQASEDVDAGTLARLRSHRIEAGGCR